MDASILSRFSGMRRVDEEMKSSGRGAGRERARKCEEGLKYPLKFSFGCCCLWGSGFGGRHPGSLGLTRVVPPPGARMRMPPTPLALSSCAGNHGPSQLLCTEKGQTCDRLETRKSKKREKGLRVREPWLNIRVNIRSFGPSREKKGMPARLDSQPPDDERAAFFVFNTCTGMTGAWQDQVQTLQTWCVPAVRCKLLRCFVSPTVSQAARTTSEAGWHTFHIG